MQKLKALRVALEAAVCVVPITTLATSGAVLPPDLEERLAGLPMDGKTATKIGLPTGDGTRSTFEIRDSRTLPPALAAKFPGLRSFRGIDVEGRSVRLDLSAGGIRMSVRDGSHEWTLRARTREEWLAGASGSLEAPPFAAEAASHPMAGETKKAMDLSVNTTEAVEPAVTHEDFEPAVTNEDFEPAVMREAFGWEAALAAKAGLSRYPSSARGGNVRYDFRLAVAASSRYAAKFGGTVEGTLAEVAHAVNRANEVFETDVGVHFTLVDHNERLIRTRASRDPFRREDPGTASVKLIEREIGAGGYDLGHALTDYYGGESHVGTSCSDARDADFFGTHKAAAWSGHANPETEPYALGFMIHVLGRQLGAWPTANGCTRATLDDRAFEPGSGSTIMSHAPAGCGSEQSLQGRVDLYFHAANIAQMHDWLAARGGRCATKRINPATAPWIDPAPIAEQAIIPARTPFFLEAHAEPEIPGQHLTYAWEQMDAGARQRGALVDRGDGPLFRSYPPTPSARRTFPRMAAVLGYAPSAPGEALPRTSRTLNLHLTVRDHGGDTSTVAHADTRLRVIDTGQPFAIHASNPAIPAIAGAPLTVRWDVAGTDQEPISCHFVEIDLSLDGGDTWLTPALATDERNDGEARLSLPPGVASEHARLRIRCDWRPFFAVSPEDFIIVRLATD